MTDNAQDLTLGQLLALADERVGGRQQVLHILEVSRQRIQSALTGGPPLHATRLVKLGMSAGVSPFDALRAGGRADFAALLEQALRSELRRLTPLERQSLREFRRLTDVVRTGSV
jgi:hypothetical protein